MNRDLYVVVGGLKGELMQIRRHNWMLTMTIGGMLLALALIGLPFLYTAGTRAVAPTPTQVKPQ